VERKEIESQSEEKRKSEESEERVRRE